MLRAWWPFANFSDVLANLHRQIVQMVGIPRIILDNGTALRECRVDTTKQKDSGQRQGSHCHSILPARRLTGPTTIYRQSRSRLSRALRPSNSALEVSRDISYEPVRHRAPQGGDYDSELTQTLRGDGLANVRWGSKPVRLRSSI